MPWDVAPEPLADPARLREWFGDIDLYLFDQLLKGRIARSSRLLDAGCGNGRNLVFLLRCGIPVWAVDHSPAAIASVRELAARLAPELPPDRFRVERLEALSFADASFDVVLCNAVLHFAADSNQFRAMLRGLWRVLRPGGLLFARLATSDGLEERIVWRGDHVGRLPDGSERFLVDAPLLTVLTRRLGGVLEEPLRTVLVHGQRSMTTWVVRKGPAPGGDGGAQS